MSRIKMSSEETIDDAVAWVRYNVDRLCTNTDEKLELVDKLTAYSKSGEYLIPRCCHLPAYMHSDGIGGCWGIKFGFVQSYGNVYCKDCEYYRLDTQP